MSELMTVEELGQYLRFTRKTIYRLLKQGSIPSVKIGNKWRFVKASINAWLRQNPAGKTANVLVIDDDETICSLFKDTLEEEGHTVTAVNESSKGLELVKQRDYDLVFLDLKMPEMDGVELFRQIRATKPELPVTIITGYPDSDLMMSALTYGPLGVISKPFSGSDIITAVNNHLRFGMATR